MTVENEKDLDWLAFQYIADELTESDREAFEQRLAGDQQACEAVARAVEVTQTLVAANAVDQLAETALVTTAQRATWWRRATLVALVTTACLALVLVYQGVRSHFVRTPVDGDLNVVASAADNMVSQRLAIAWLETRAEMPTPESGIWYPELSEEQALFGYPPESTGEVPPESTGEVPPEITAPSWMLAAVSGLMENPDHTFGAPIEELK